MMEELKESHPSLKKLNLSGHQIETIENIEILDSIQNLNLSKNQITSLNGLNQLKNLKILDVSSNQITTWEGISKLTGLEILNIADNNIADLAQIEKFKANINLRELDLRNNPVWEVENYRDIVLDLLPNLRMLDQVSVSDNGRMKKGPIDLKRLAIESQVDKFLSGSVTQPPKPPHSKSPDERRSLERSSPSISKHGRNISGGSIPIQEVSKHAEANSMNYSLGSVLKGPLLNLDNGRKNDSSGLFTFMYDHGIDKNRSEAKFALSEIINIQEEYIQKRSTKINMDLMKKWREKVFDLLFQLKTQELMNAEKFKVFQMDRNKLLDELDNAHYLRMRSEKEWEAVKHALNQKEYEFEHITGTIKDEEFNQLQSQVKLMISSHSQEFEDQHQKLNDSLFTLQSYHKRLQILQKRIKTYAQLMKSEQDSYVEKYRQLKKQAHAHKERQGENDELRLEVKELKKVIEEKELQMVSLQHKLNLEKGKQ